MTTPQHTAADIARVELIVGMEVHVELATRTKMFSRVASPAHAHAADAAPNTLIDPVTLALPGALPVMNKDAVEMAMLVGLALRCTIADFTKWDRKSYFYPDMPKAYQISQYDLPLCFDGAFDLPAPDAQGFPDLSAPPRRIGILRAHLEEDAGKLLHEAPGGHAIGFSIVDYNRAGTPLLEIVTQPDFRSADEAVLFAKLLRQTCRALGVTQGVMQKGHMRFEPNINCAITMKDGASARTPIVEVKNLNSFRSLKGAIEFELADQPRRYLADGRTAGPGTKSTRGWDDHALRTVPQRDKEDAHDYRYFPDPDLVPVRVDAAWRERVAARMPTLPLERFHACVQQYGLGVKEATALSEERAVSEFYDGVIDGLVALGVPRTRAGKLAANVLLQSGQKRANERSAEGAEPVLLSELGITPAETAALAHLRETGRISNQSLDELFGEWCGPHVGQLGIAQAAEQAETLAKARGLLIQRNDDALAGWVAAAILAHPQAAADVKAGKLQAAGRLVGEAMKLAGGAADAKVVREAILKALGQG
ncbi:MAG: Asp-tRNA(Asn)/Glu-tRNA(Gln) amidotransferase subunit GatB [Phycisphaerales bacterium]